MKKRQFRILFILCIMFSFSLNAHSSRVDSIESIELFGDVFAKVKEMYVEDVTDERLIENAVSGMLSGLDPHSGFLNSKNFKEIKVKTRGEFGGVGIEMSSENGVLKIISPLDGMPAAEAGIQSGDYILDINGETAVGMSITDAVEKLRGEPNSKVKITVMRKNHQDPLLFTLKRAVIHVNPVIASIKNNVLYLRIASFTEKTSVTFANAIKKAMSDDRNLIGAVVDLRNNAGGLLDQAIEVCSMMLDSGEIVSTRGRRAENVKRFDASGPDLLNSLPIVVIINNGSASASEIVAGALKDHRRAIIVGTKSFGKGSVQTILPVRSDAAIKLTTAVYYTPSGVSIQAHGIIPDIEVEELKVQFPEQSSYFESDLPNHLRNKQRRNNTHVKKDDENIYVNDYQLAVATDVLKSINIAKYMVHNVKKSEKTQE